MTTFLAVVVSLMLTLAVVAPRVARRGCGGRRAAPALQSQSGEFEHEGRSGNCRSSFPVATSIVLGMS